MRGMQMQSNDAMSPFFSIIVPCCDVEPYVRECLKSVLDQDFGDWECLAVVEQSRDATERAVREIAGTDGRFKVFTEPRSGSPATPRNTGLDHACGEYVVFLDGDDFLAEGSLGRLAARIRERPQADLFPCAFHDWREGRGSVRIVDNWPASAPPEMSGTDSLVQMFGHVHTPVSGAQFTVYRRAFLEKADLRFVPGLVYEDLEFLPRAFCPARRVAPLHEPFYMYRTRADSIMGASRAAGPKMEHYARVLKSLFAFHASIAKKPGFDAELSRLFGRSWIALLRTVWFSPSSVASATRARRLETLREVFAGGFGDFRALLSAASLSRRVAGWCVMAFVRFPPLRGIAETFLVRIYSNLAWRRRGR